MSSRLDTFLAEQNFREYRWIGGGVLQGDPREDGALELLLKQGVPEESPLALVNFGCGAWVQSTPNQDILALHVFFTDHLVCARNLVGRSGSLSLAATPKQAVTDHELSQKLRQCGGAALRMFRDMALNWEWIFTLGHLLPPKALVHVIGENDDGIKAIGKRLAQLGVSAESVAVGCHARWFAFPAGAIAQKGSLPSLEATAEIHTPQGVFRMCIPEGVFAAGHLDAGTALLLEQAGDLNGFSVWDFGCGAGIVARAALAAGAQSIYASDHSLIAVEASRENLRDFATKAVVAAHFLDDGISATFDRILTNPPFHLEAREIRDFGRIWLAACLARLNLGGEIRLVCNAFLPYPQFAKELGCSASELAAGQGFKVWKIQRK